MKTILILEDSNGVVTNDDIINFALSTLLLNDPLVKGKISKLDSIEETLKTDLGINIIGLSNVLANERVEGDAVVDDETKLMIACLLGRNIEDDNYQLAMSAYSDLRAAFGELYKSHQKAVDVVIENAKQKKETVLRMLGE